MLLEVRLEVRLFVTIHTKQVLTCLTVCAMLYQTSNNSNNSSQNSKTFRSQDFLLAFTPYTNPCLYTLHFTPYTNPCLYTLHSTPYALHFLPKKLAHVKENVYLCSAIIAESCKNPQSIIAESCKNQ